MHTRSESDITVEVGHYTMTLSKIVRHNTEKTRGCNHEKEYYPAYQWQGEILIKNLWFGTKLNGVFMTDHFSVKSVEGLSMSEILFIILKDNHLYVPDLSNVDHGVHVALEHYVIDRILLNHLLANREWFSIEPLEIDFRRCDYIISLVVDRLIPAHEFSPVSVK